MLINTILTLPTLTEIKICQEIERSARARYANIPDLSFVVTAPGIAVERFLTGDTILAKVDGRIEGYVLMQPMDGLLYIANIMVRDGASGRGIGRALMDAAHLRAKHLRLSGTALATFKHVAWNGPWYRKLGYETMAEDKIGPGLRAILDRHATALDMSKRETLWRAV
jgi:ribosomal protein S18 acetylase RimI-like enzyme